MHIKRFLLLPLLCTALFLSTSIKADARVYLDDNLVMTYGRSPYCVRNTFEINDWDIEVVDGYELNSVYGPSAELDEGYFLAGVTNYEIHTIYLSDIGELAYSALNHEMGHFFDYSYYQLTGIVPSKTQQFEYIYSQEGTSSEIFEDYTVGYAQEYFAQAYKHYCEDKEDLGLFYPLTFAYLDEMIGNYEKLLEAGHNVIYDNPDAMKIVPAAAKSVDDGTDPDRKEDITVQIKKEQQKRTVPYNDSIKKITVRSYLTSRSITER